MKKEDAQIWAVFKIKSPSLDQDWLLFKLGNVILIAKYIKMNFYDLKKRAGEDGGGEEGELCEAQM